ncbi:MAG: biopolymer transporter ExbD [Planctomycetia bacterium]|nr:biopolymer transporter ExbD [Planctomycetia bacterium]
MSWRKRKGHQHEEVTLNLTAMLDMAFQLLAYLILTFHSPIAEAQINLRMPDPVAVGGEGSAVIGGEPQRHDPREYPLDQLVVNVYSDHAGGVGQITSGTSSKNSKISELTASGTLEQKVGRLHHHLQGIFGDPGQPFDKMTLQVSGDIAYNDVMQVVDACARVNLADGKRLQNVTFIELPAGNK